MIVEILDTCHVVRSLGFLVVIYQCSFLIEPAICKKKSMPVFSFDLFGEMSGMAVIFIGEHSPLMENTPRRICYRKYVPIVKIVSKVFRWL